MCGLKQAGSPDSYRLVASVYEWIEACYSGGAISACKRAQMDYLREGDKVLYAGAGTASEAAWAAAAGARVTLLDRSQAMLAMARRRFHKAGLPAPHCWHGELTSYPNPGEMDVVVANFFLNVFVEDELARVIEKLSTLLKPGGLLLIGDFSPFRGKGQVGWFQKLYWYFPLFVASRITGEPVHPFYEYEPFLEEAGLTVRKLRSFRLGRFGPAWYRLIIAA